MKKQAIIFAIALLVLGSCKKKPVTSCSTSPNMVTVTDGGDTYESCGNSYYNLQTATNAGISVVFSKDTVHPASCHLYIYAGTDNPFSMSVSDSLGPFSTGIGTYTLQAIDSSKNFYSENFSGGQSFKISGGTINVTNLETANIAGTFSINVFNSIGSKVITGSFNANDPNISE